MVELSAILYETKLSFCFKIKDYTLYSYLCLFEIFLLFYFHLNFFNLYICTAKDSFIFKLQGQISP